MEGASHHGFSSSSTTSNNYAAQTRIHGYEEEGKFDVFKKALCAQGKDLFAEIDRLYTSKALHEAYLAL
ncbi:MAG: hypothetical protein Q6M04_05930, partial [Thermostichus sp. BF3_bins_97]